MWSGGKDSALALERAKRAGIDVARLISFYDSSTRRVRFHATRVEILQSQSALAGISLHAIPTSWPQRLRSARPQCGRLRAWLRSAPVGRIKTRLEPIDDPSHLRPVARLSSGDQLAQGVGFPGKERLGA